MKKNKKQKESLIGEERNRFVGQVRIQDNNTPHNSTAIP